MQRPLPFHRLQPFALLLLTLLSTICTAQQAAPVSTQTDFAIVLLADSPADITYFNRGAPMRMHLLPYERSSLQKYQGPNQLALYQSSATDALPPQPDAAPDASVTLPAGTNSVLILLAPATDGTLHAVALNNDENAFPRGNARILNATSVPLAISTGEQPILLQPGGQQLLRGNGLNLQLKVAGRIDGAWQLLDTSLFGLKDHARRTIILLKSDSRQFQLQAGEEATTLDRPLQIFSFLN